MTSATAIQNNQVHTSSADITNPSHPLKYADPKEALARYLSDESTKDIAESYGVTRQALGQWLLKCAEGEWKDAQIARAIARKESADEEIERAPDILSLARAKEKLRSAQWDLERVCRRIYGQDAPPPGAAIQINIGISRHDNSTASAQVIEDKGSAADSTSAG